MKKRVLIILLAAVLAAVSAGCTVDPVPAKRNYAEPVAFDGAPHTVGVMFVNVGKADAAIVSIDGRVWVIDTGTDASFPKLFAALKLMGAESIDGVMITHGHSDHIGGLEALSGAFPIGRVMFPSLLLDRVKVENKVLSLGLSGEYLRVGDKVGIADGVFFEVLAPTVQDPDDDNDNSLVLRLAVNGRTFLFTGDMQLSEDERLLASGADVLCDVLKVPNHGNPDALGEAFANAANPLIAVISTDTSVDTDSANELVMRKLASAEKYLTQDRPLGVLLNVSDKGVISVSFPDYPERMTGAELTVVSKEGQYFTVKNTTDDYLDLSGWIVFSTRGGEVFVFPDGSVLKAGASFTVACKKSDVPADCIWDVKKAWANSKDDFAVLLDRNGCEAARRISE